jgi:hypothetical protein
MLGKKQKRKKTVPPKPEDDQYLDCEGLTLTCDRSPHHPLRSISITIPADFDEPMTDLWDALEQ